MARKFHEVLAPQITETRTSAREKPTSVALFESAGG